MLQAARGSPPVNGGMAKGTKPRCAFAIISDADTPDARQLQPSAYMLGLSEQVASMADAVLIVQGKELPVHTYILAANSPVFAAMLETAQTTPQKSKTLHHIPLPGDRLAVVCTALRYMYIGSLVVSPSMPAIKSCQDAAALVSFAHKYSITQLVDKAEIYLIGEACDDGGQALFGDPEHLVAWVILAETCKLDLFLAYAERFMIQHLDASFWQGALAEVDSGISQQCFLRVLRGALHGRQELVRSVEVLKEHLVSSGNDGLIRRCSYCRKLCGGTCASFQSLMVNVDDLDVSINTLTKWHKQDA